MSDSQRLWTLNEVLTWVVQRFRRADIDTAVLDAQLLLCRVLQTTRVGLYTDSQRPLTAEERGTLRDFVARRLAGEPVAYILNERFWYDLPFYVDKRVLIPRPETECLLDFVIESIDSMPSFQGVQPVIVDLCTGSGCLAIALAKRYPQADVTGVDVSEDALEVARRNADRHQVNVRWLLCDLAQAESFQIIRQQIGHRPHVVVANPPYVAESCWAGLDISVKQYEPRLALVSPDAGLFLGRCIWQHTQSVWALTPGPFVFAMEMGVGHPASLVGESLPAVPFRSAYIEKPINRWFSLGDMENRQRFLCRLEDT